MNINISCQMRRSWFELGGTVDLTFASNGLQCRLEIPADWVSSDAPVGGSRALDVEQSSIASDEARRRDARMVRGTAVRLSERLQWPGPRRALGCNLSPVLRSLPFIVPAHRRARPTARRTARPRGASCRRASRPYRSGKCDWVKVKCAQWKEDNKDRGDLFMR
jgi:hypothetical protein